MSSRTIGVKQKWSWHAAIVILPRADQVVAALVLAAACSVSVMHLCGLGQIIKLDPKVVSQ